MKKFLSLLLIVALSLSVFVGCGKDDTQGDDSAQTSTEDTNTDNNDADADTDTEKETEDTDADASALVDGIYYAESDEFDPESGWKDNVTVEVKDGKIASAKWNGTNVVPQGDKLTASENGNYPMVEFGGAQAEWHEQAAATEAWLLENQDPKAITIAEDGKTDTIAGVSIHVSEYFALVEKALASEPVVAGELADGVHTATLEPDSKGWAYAGDFTVINGTIVSVNYNAVNKDEEGNVSDKKTLGFEYGMKEGGASAEWFEQAESVEAFVLENQGLDVELNEEGKTDAIAGVSIHVDGFQEVLTKAFE